MVKSIMWTVTDIVFVFCFSTAEICHSQGTVFVVGVQ